MNEITKELLDALHDCERVMSAELKGLLVIQPELEKARAAIAKAEAALAEPQADEDGWIPWSGGECPLEYGVIHHARFRDGCESALDADAPGWLGWKHRGADFDIIAYRVVKP